MAVKSAAELKAKFETGDQPTAQDFIDLIDSILLANFENWPATLPAASGANLTDIEQALILNEYVEITQSPGYVAADELAFTGDFTATLRSTRRIQLTLDSGNVYTEIETVNYDAINNITECVLLDAVADNTISKAAVGLFKPVADGGAIGFGLLGVSAFARQILDDADADAVRTTISALQNVLTTRGDLVYQGADGPVRLPKGTAGQVLQMGSNDPAWADVGIPLGGYIAVQSDLAGAAEPPSSSYIKLTAGEDGVGEYNEGKLTNESVSGSAPLVVATADIDDAGSPMNGQTVHLLNTENRYLMPGTSPGSVANDQLQNMTGVLKGNFFRADSQSGVFGGAVSASGLVASGSNNELSTTFDASRVARTGDHTNVKHIETTYYMRYK